MKTIGDIITDVKRFVLNNTSAADSFQGEMAGLDLGTFMDAACLTAANNARLWAERNASFDWLEVTVPATFYPGLGINLNRLYVDDMGYDLGLEDTWFATRVDARGILYIALAASSLANTSEPNLTIQTIQITDSLVYFGSTENLDAALTVLEEMPAETLGAVPCRIYKMAYTVASPPVNQTWFSQPFTLLVSRFSQVLAMNSIRACDIMLDGGTYPLSLDTRQGQHTKSLLRLNKGMPLWETDQGLVSAMTSLRLPTAFKVGHELKLNFAHDVPISVELSGTRWMNDYTTTADTDMLVQRGPDFMMWQMIIELNHIVQIYVPRSEGSLPPPVKARDEAWSSLLVNDAYTGSNFYHE